MPKESIHLGKKVSRVVSTDDGVTLYFEDGTEARGDLLIGADGTKSVRKATKKEKRKGRQLNLFLSITENKAVIYPRVQVEIHRKGSLRDPRSMHLWLKAKFRGCPLILYIGYAYSHIYYMYKANDLSVGTEG